MQAQAVMTKKPLVMITGASSGIGRSTARVFSEDGHPLLLISRRIEPLPELKSDRVLYEQVDVVDYDAVVKAVKKAEQHYGTTGCLVNSAAIVDARDFREIDQQSYSREIDVNLKGLLNCTKAVLAGMIENKSGTIINISSVSDRKTTPVAVAYTATKYAVRAATESLRESVAKDGVRFVNLAPAYVKTNIHKNMEITFEEYCQMLGNPDFMEPEQVAEIILYCWKLPANICVRDLVVAPTKTTF
jgi:NADP-dependent 3-hydroxy acid dehydrogenase YdfG